MPRAEHLAAPEVPFEESWPDEVKLWWFEQYGEELEEPRPAIALTAAEYSEHQWLALRRTFLTDEQAERLRKLETWYPQLVPQNTSDEQVAAAEAKEPDERTREEQIIVDTKLNRLPRLREERRLLHIKITEMEQRARMRAFLGTSKERSRPIIRRWHSRDCKPRRSPSARCHGTRGAPTRPRREDAPDEHDVSALAGVTA